MKKPFTLWLIVSLYVGATAQPVPTAEFPFKMTVEQYVEKYAPIAVEEMHKSRIPASITLAQGLLESGNGNSRLALEGNNHFGIKCKKDWTGETMNEDDDAPQECFRKYKAPLESYRDHSDFLMKNARYAFLFDLESTDYKGWAHGLKKAGYATNPRYPQLLIATIEKNNLTRFDQMKPGEKEIERIAEEKKTAVAQQRNVMVNGIPAVVARADDGYAGIALENDMRVWQIYKYNDLSKTAQIRAGDTIYLKPKNYLGSAERAVVQPGETMHILSQRYGIKLSRLLAKNLMKEGEEPAAGETVFLRDRRKEKPVLFVEAALVASPDSVRRNIVYEDPRKNIETMEPVLPVDPYDPEAAGVKEEMAFFHTVQPGETLFSISKKYNVAVEAIRDLNKLGSPDIRAGTQLIINPNQPPLDEKEEAVVPGYHTVRQGETWYAIARRYNTQVDQLKALNPHQSDTLHIGDELVVVPMNGEKVPQDAVTTDPSEVVYHLVREKETMYSITRKYNVEASQIRRLNDLLDNTVYVGQRLRIR